MKERTLLRFDTMIAICALLISSIAAGAMVYQTRVIEDQFSATIWPYLSVDTVNSPTSVSIRLVNDGAGPALIRSAGLSIDGKAAPGWSTALSLFLHDRAFRGIHGSISSQNSSIDASTTIRPGDAHPLIAITTTPRLIAIARKHRFTLDFCYCSLNGRCWRLHDDLNSATPTIPQTVGGCKIGSSIRAGV